MVSATPFSTDGMNLVGMAPPTTALSNTKPAAPLQGLDAQRGHAELAPAAGLLLVAALGVARRR